MSTVIKFPSLILLRRVATSLITIIAATIRIIVGALAGVVLSSIKKLLSYSRVAQSGWLIILTIQTQE